MLDATRWFQPLKRERGTSYEPGSKPCRASETAARDTSTGYEIRDTTVRGTGFGRRLVPRISYSYRVWRFRTWGYGVGVTSYLVSRYSWDGLVSRFAVSRIAYYSQQMERLVRVRGIGYQYNLYHVLTLHVGSELLGSLLDARTRKYLHPPRYVKLTDKG